jgi:hypothetical protein
MKDLCLILGARRSHDHAGRAHLAIRLAHDLGMIDNAHQGLVMDDMSWMTMLHTPQGSEYAMAMLSYLHDPVVMATWIQAMSGDVMSRSSVMATMKIP